MKTLLLAGVVREIFSLSEGMYLGVALFGHVCFPLALLATLAFPSKNVHLAFLTLVHHRLLS